VDAENSLWIGNDVCINIQYANLTFERIGYEEGDFAPTVTPTGH